MAEASLHGRIYGVSRQALLGLAPVEQLKSVPFYYDPKHLLRSPLPHQIIGNLVVGIGVIRIHSGPFIAIE